jgi:hypothetical protein
MLIRDNNGNIVNIKRSDFITDSDYYKQLSLFYGINLNKLNNIFNGNKVDNLYLNNDSTIKTKHSKEKILDMIKMM